MTEPGTARGSDANYCSYWSDESTANEGHHMVSHSAGQKVKWVERCAFCGWIDAAALDRWADNAIKESISQRAQRIAVATETEPFAFVQRSDEELSLEEILFQSLGAASMCWDPRPGNLVFDSSRAAAIGHNLLAEVNRAMRESAKDWSDLAYELYALACNSSPMQGYPEMQRSEWEAAFKRLRDRFHELLPSIKEEAAVNGHQD